MKDRPQAIEQANRAANPDLAGGAAGAQAGKQPGSAGADGDVLHEMILLFSEDASSRTRTSERSPGKSPSKSNARPRDAELAQPEEPEQRLGEVLGSYRLIELIGCGGMGWVYRAEHVMLGRQVALKLLRKDRAGRRDAVARFFNEARTVNRIRHHNLVDITDLVELDSGATFIIMELLCGFTLGEWMHMHHGETARILDLAVQVCDGLAAAHRVGVVHRDLKPDNIIIVPAGDGTEQVKLLDFGIAKLLDSDALGPETGAGTLMGTPAYMSPEQAGGLPVDARSDIYSLGAILYELFTRERVFQGKSLGEYVRKHLNEAPRPPRATPEGADMDPRLEALILRCLAKKPRARYGSVDQVRADLVALRAACLDPDSAAVVIRASSLDGLPSRSSTRGIPAVHGSDPAEGRHAAGRRWPWALALGAGTGMGALLLALLGQPDAPRASPIPPARTPTPPPVSAGSPVSVRPSATPAPGPSAVTIRFDSMPGAEVRMMGAEDVRCRTPCDLTLPPGALLDESASPPAHAMVEIAEPGYRPVQLGIDPDDPWQVVYVQLDALHRDRDQHAAGAAAATSGAPERPARTKPGALSPEQRRPQRQRRGPRKARPPVRPGDTLDPFAASSGP